MKGDTNILHLYPNSLSFYYIHSIIAQLKCYYALWHQKSFAVFTEQWMNPGVILFLCFG